MKQITHARPSQNEKGFVLVIVLFFLVITIILGVSLIRSTITEMRIAGNERRFTQNFYGAISATEIIIPQFDAIVSAMVLTPNNRVDVTSRMPANTAAAGAIAGITLIKSGTPPVSSGQSASKVSAYFYKIDATMNSQGIEMGVWKAFPSAE